VHVSKLIRAHVGGFLARRWADGAGLGCLLASAFSNCAWAAAVSVFSCFGPVHSSSQAVLTWTQETQLELLTCVSALTYPLLCASHHSGRWWWQKGQISAPGVQILSGRGQLQSK
jgi:hypothetical protein